MPRTRARLLVLGLLALSGCGPGLFPTRTTGGNGGFDLIRTLDSSWISLAGLVFYAKFDETTASDTSPISESGGNALVSSLVTGDGVTNKSVSGKLGKALNFDGTNDYVTVTDPGAGSPLDFNTGDSLTIMAWIKPSALPPTGQTIVGKGATANTDNANFGFQTGNSAQTFGDRLNFYFFDGASWVNYSSTVSQLVTGTWQHVAFTVTFGAAATSSAKVYYNGALVAGGWIGTETVAPVLTNEPLWIGGSNDSAGSAVSSPYSGAIDEISVWKRALSGSEILAAAQRPNL